MRWKRQWGLWQKGKSEIPRDRRLHAESSETRGHRGTWGEVSRGWKWLPGDSQQRDRKPSPYSHEDWILPTACMTLDKGPADQHLDPGLLRHRAKKPTKTAWTSDSKQCEIVNACCFKSPSVCYLVTAAIGNQHREQAPSRADNIRQHCGCYADHLSGKETWKGSIRSSVLLWWLCWWRRGT